MTGSSPISIQAQCEPAPIVPAVIQIPKAMIPIEMENENASFMMASKDLCLSDRCQSVSKFRHQPGPASRPDHPALKGSNAGACDPPSADTAALRTASREEKPVRGTIEPLIGALRPVQVTDQFAGKTINIDPF